MRPTRLPVLALAVLLAAAAGYLVAETSYAQIPPLPALAPLSLLLLSVVEAGLTVLVRNRLRGRRPAGRPLHPLQIARAAVLAKASSLGGSVVGGAYTGIFVWTFGRRGEVATYGNDAWVAGLAAAAGAVLVLAALLLERACRTPSDIRG